MDNKSFRILTTVNGKDMIFNVTNFRNYCREYRETKRENGNKYNQDDLFADIAEVLLVGEETVKKWHKGANGPSDLIFVDKIAAFFGIQSNELLTEKGRGKMQEKNSIQINNEEREVIFQVYRFLVDVIYFETSRFDNPEYNDNTVFQRELDALRKKAYEIVDKNSLIISDETRNKLYNILREMDNSLGRMEIENVRWSRINPYHYATRTMYEDDYDECEDEERRKIIEDVYKDFERGYYVEVKGKYGISYCEQLPYNTDLDKLAYELCDSGEIVSGLIPMDDYARTYNNSTLYRAEYCKTLIGIFKEEFSEQLYG